MVLTTLGGGRRIGTLSYLTAFAFQQIIYKRIIEVSREAQTIKVNRWLPVTKGNSSVIFSRKPLTT